MKEALVFTHLDTCPGPTPQKKPAAKVPALGSSLARQHNTSLERLPALNYSMLKDNALRKRLAELGISNSGARALLERRHKEYITMWNANCDAARPKSRHDLLRQLDAWERTQGGRAPVGGRAAQNAAIIKDKDFDGSAWASQHNDSFKDLIASARQSSLAARQKAKEGGSSTPPQQAEMSTTSGGNETSMSSEPTLEPTPPNYPQVVPVSGPSGDHPEHDDGGSRPPDPADLGGIEQGGLPVMAPLSSENHYHPSTNA